MLKLSVYEHQIFTLYYILKRNGELVFCEVGYIVIMPNTSNEQLKIWQEPIFKPVTFSRPTLWSDNTTNLSILLDNGSAQIFDYYHHEWENVAEGKNLKFCRNYCTSLASEHPNKEGSTSKSVWQDGDGIVDALLAMEQSHNSNAALGNNAKYIDNILYREYQKVTEDENNTVNIQTNNNTGFIAPYMQEYWEKAKTVYAADEIIGVETILRAIVAGDTEKAVKLLVNGWIENGSVVSCVAMFKSEGINVVKKALLEKYGEINQKNKEFLERYERYHNQKLGLGYINTKDVNNKPPTKMDKVISIIHPTEGVQIFLLIIAWLIFIGGTLCIGAMLTFHLEYFNKLPPIRNYYLYNVWLFEFVCLGFSSFTISHHTYIEDSPIQNFIFLFICAGRWITLSYANNNLAERIGMSKWTAFALFLIIDLCSVIIFRIIGAKTSSDFRTEALNKIRTKSMIALIVNFIFIAIAVIVFLYFLKNETIFSHITIDSNGVFRAI